MAPISTFDTVTLEDAPMEIGEFVVSYVAQMGFTRPNLIFYVGEKINFYANFSTRFSIGGLLFHSGK